MNSPRFAKLAVLCLLSACGLRAAYPIHATFLNFYRNLTPELWALEFQSMRAVDINTVVVESVGHLRADSSDELGYSLAPDGLLYPSDFVDAAERPTRDLLETILSLADQNGMKVYLGSLKTATDWTDGTEFTALRTYNQRVALEVLARYSQHPSLRGWYFTQEIWMNWVKQYGATYYGLSLLGDWAADIKNVDPGGATLASGCEEDGIGRDARLGGRRTRAVDVYFSTSGPHRYSDAAGRYWGRGRRTISRRSAGVFCRHADGG